MGGPVHCSCGALLVEEVTDAGVRLPGADSILRLRRRTDYVVCQSCMLAYSVRSLMAGGDGDVTAVHQRPARREGDQQ